MWQRIQTLYLAVVAILSSLQLFLPLAGFTDLATANVYAFKACHLLDLQTGETVQTAYFLPLLPLIITIIAIITIFLYKKRVLQMRLCVINIILAALSYAYLYLHIYFATKGIEQYSLFFNIPASFQLINVILMVLAFRGVAHDEALVRAADRMR